MYRHTGYTIRMLEHGLSLYEVSCEFPVLFVAMNMEVAIWHLQSRFTDLAISKGYKIGGLNGKLFLNNEAKFWFTSEGLSEYYTKILGVNFCDILYDNSCTHHSSPFYLNEKQELRFLNVLGNVFIVVMPLLL